MDYRVDAQAAYVLHTRPYRETSLIADFFTLEFGRVSAVVKGGRSPNSKMRGVIQPFVPLSISWKGKQELKSLTQAEAVALNGILQGTPLVCGLYINELLQKILSPFDAYPKLYLYYQYVLNELVANNDLEGALRTFENRLLVETGYGLPLESVRVDQWYFFSIDNWQFLPVSHFDGVEKKYLFNGNDLLALKNDCYDTKSVRQSAKRLMRLSIDHLLNGRTLQSRSLF